MKFSRFVLLMVLVPAFAGLAQVSISGKVTSAMGTPVKGAIVKLLTANMADTTDSNGVYTLGIPTAVLHSTLPGSGSIQSVQYSRGRFVVTASSPASLTLRLFDLSGSLLARVYSGRCESGSTEIAFPLRKFGTSLFLLNVASDRTSDTYRLSSMPGSAFSVVRLSTSAAMLGKRNALDSLVASKTGYITSGKGLASLIGTNDIVLQTEGTGSSGATIFWDFEDGKLPAGAKAATYPGATAPVGPLPVIDNTKTYKGSYALHYATMHSATNRIFMYTLPANWGPVLWGRAYIYFTPSLPMPVAGATSSHGTMFKGIYNPSRYWYEWGAELGLFFLDQHIPEPPGYPEWCIYNNVTPEANTWLCLEWVFNGIDDGTGNASEPRIFINGEELPPVKKVLWNETFFPDKPAGKYLPVQDFVEIWLGMQEWHQWLGFDEFWLDDVAISKTRIGIK